MLVLLSAMAVACHGKRDYEQAEAPTKTLKVEYDRNRFDADGVDAVSFAVKYGVDDVTSFAKLSLVEVPQGAATSDYTLSANRLTSSVAGRFVLRAEYDGQRSATVSVTAVEVDKPSDGGDDKPSAYARHSCVFEFTGAWCSFCPDGYVFLKYLIMDYFDEDRVHIIAMHDKTGGDDPMGVPLTNQLYNQFGLAAYPSFIVDMREATEDKNNLQTMLNATFNDYPSHCGVRLSTTYDASKRKCDISAEVTAEKSDSYRVALYVLEHKIIARQARNGLYIDDYEHNHVFRTLATQSSGGDRLGDLAAGEKATLARSITLDTGWVAENMSVCALVIGADGYVNNVAECALCNGLADYDMAK